MGTVSGQVRGATDALEAGRIVRAYRRDNGALLGTTVSSDGTVPWDSDYANTQLLLHMDGANGGTTFTDSSPSPKTLTPSNVTTSTAQVKYGSASAAFNGSNSLITAPASSAWNLGSNYTVEAWLYLNALPSGAWCRWVMIGANSTSSGLQVLAINTDGTIGHSLPLGGTTGIGTSAGVAVAGTWFHLAVSVIAGTARIFKNGTVVAGPTVITTQSVSSGDGLRIGSDTTGTVDAVLNGYIDDLRITKGVGRYSAAFTPPGVLPDGSTLVPFGSYGLLVEYSGEVNVICLDDVAGTTYNDLILRTTPV